MTVSDLPARSSRPLILALDTAGAACSVAVAAGGALLAEARRDMAHGHGEALLPMVAATMAQAGLAPSMLDLVAVTIGPGGFTGIRIGLAAARGIALTLGVPLIGVTGFTAVVAALAPTAGFTLVAIESRRADLYLQLYDDRGDGGCRPHGDPAAVAPPALPDFVAAAVGPAVLRLAGDAAERALAALAGRPATMLAAGSAPGAPGVAAAALARWHAGDRDGTARPFYLRPPDVTLAR